MYLLKLSRVWLILLNGASYCSSYGIWQNVFSSAYFKILNPNIVAAIEAHLVGQVIEEMINQHTQSQWTGTPSQLLDELNIIAGNLKININDKAWPKAT